MMESHQGGSSRAAHRDGAGTSGADFIRRRLSRSLHPQNPPGRHHALSVSVSSLDRIFDTQRSDGPQIPVTKSPSLTSDDKSFIERKHGISEVRDGFFDAVFLPPEDVDTQALIEHAEGTLPFAFRKKDPLSLTRFFPRQLHEAWGVIRRVLTTRSGIKLFKSFSGFLIAYILCLIPAVRKKFGRYAYIMAVSAILNHPGRTLGAQVDGAVLTVIGTATGLGWGAFGLWVSTATATARIGFGAILALFLFTFIFVIACLRSYYIRTYQLVICAGIAISYTCLAEISANEVSRIKLLNYGVPWLIGQAISLLVCSVAAPDAGSRPLAVGIHQIFDTMLDGIPPIVDSVRTRRRLAQAFVSMSQVHRDLAIDFSITSISPQDSLILRNSVQAMIRSLLSLRPNTEFSGSPAGDDFNQDGLPHQGFPEFVIEMDSVSRAASRDKEKKTINFVADSLAIPTENLLHSMRVALQSCDAALMDMCGHRHNLGPPYTVSSDLRGTLVNIRKHIAVLNAQQEKVLTSDRLSHIHFQHPDTFKTFAFCRPVQQAASSVESLVVRMNEIQQRQPKYPRFHPPSYPIRKAIHRTNAQVRHDRGGVTAGSYFRSLSDIAKIIKEIRSRDFHPAPHKGTLTNECCGASPDGTTSDHLSNGPKSLEIRFRHQIWALLHRLQGFETRFGLKTALVTSLLALPAYLADSRTWWDSYGGWWAVVMGWLIMGPRTGGNVQDLFARALCAVLGSLWAALSHAAGDGNPYLMAVLATIFMLPMMYRYTQSTHPRSGLVGCLSFTVVSLSELSLYDSLPRDVFPPEAAEGDRPPVTRVAATQGALMVFGVVASVIVNWILWPFVARHDLRKGIASMMFNCSIVYRSIISQYVYYEEGDAPAEHTIQASEILEGRLREGFVRLRQLLGLTRHEIRLRAPFDPLPYAALISACEQFFDHIVTVRQSSLYYHPQFIGDGSAASIELLNYRRDEIATVLTNLYILSGALRADRPVPKYLPSAAVARKRLLDRASELERRHDISERDSSMEERRKARLGQVYSYSYNDSLTGCVEQAKQLEKYTKIIVGEQGSDCDFAIKRK